MPEPAFSVTSGRPAVEVARRARELGVRGWVQESTVHLEGPAPAVDALLRWLGGEAAPARFEGHEQFAVRGVPAGIFVVEEHQASTHHFDLRLEVEGVLRSWALPKGPSLDPAVKRLAVPVADHRLVAPERDPPGKIVWDRGSYEQRGRVAWPAALERGHAMFHLHGEKLCGGFALQRTGRGWLLIKRRDEWARAGYDVVVAEPRSVVSGRTLAQALEAG